MTSAKKNISKMKMVQGNLAQLVIYLSIHRLYDTGWCTDALLNKLQWLPMLSRLAFKVYCASKPTGFISSGTCHHSYSHKQYINR